ncbi:DNA-processing protein DprA [Lysinibacter cavernae]|uniref:DNA protecting protein DprA n=1 Tax=Lysinibacter cavernae TaxID=1640652 RepID=A0A7X5QYS0_9MICO|nr:DNA-processing protein DprA [Lysinibacter cavernae]NIH52421.1 DNA protecting protein DprA [Lysinibacter cavernae]
MSTLFGLDEALVQAAAGKLLGPLNTADVDLPAVFARSVWSRLAEPGDRVAGAVVAAIGPSEALNALLDGTLRRAIRSVEGERHREPDHDLRRGENTANGGLPGRDSAAPAARTGQTLRTGQTTSTGRDPDQSLATAIERWLPRLNSAEVLRTVDAAEQLGARLITPEHPAWPDKLNDLEFHAPLALWVRGSIEHLRCPSVSIVGSRAASGYGEHVTAEFAGGLTTRGINIVSGGAYGIDGMAHRAALAGSAPTIAVLAGGIDRLYPSGHEDLLRRIIAQGSALSELPPGFSPTRWRFLQRNRLIAALSTVTLVCEAGTRSGSLNTAAHASSLGRALGAVPGPITSAASAGCHRLLREFDASCITSLEDLDELFWGINHDPNVQANCVGGHSDDTTQQSLDGRKPGDQGSEPAGQGTEFVNESCEPNEAFLGRATEGEASNLNQQTQSLQTQSQQSQSQQSQNRQSPSQQGQTQQNLSSKAILLSDTRLPHEQDASGQISDRPCGSGSSTEQNSRVGAVRTSATSIRLLDALKPRAPKTIIELARETGLDPASVRAGLGELFAEGRAQEHDRGWTHGPTVNSAARPSRG